MLLKIRILWEFLSFCQNLRVQDSRIINSSNCFIIIVIWHFCIINVQRTLEWFLLAVIHVVESRLGFILPIYECCGGSESLRGERHIHQKRTI